MHTSYGWDEVKRVREKAATPGSNTEAMRRSDFRFELIAAHDYRRISQEKGPMIGAPK